MVGFQNTDIGLIPDDWRFGRIDEFFNIQQGKSVSKANRIGDNQKPFLRTSNLLWGKVTLNELDHLHFSKEEEAKFKLQFNDLLVCEGGDIGRTAIWKAEMNDIYYQNHLHRLRAKVEDINSEFVLYWMQYAFQFGKVYFGRANITTIPNLSKSRLSEFIIPHPPLPEQRKIAYILSTVQKAIEQQDKLIRHTTELKKALMQKLFTEGIYGEKQKQTGIGWVPESWEVVKIGEVFKFSSGKSRPKNTVKEKTEEFNVPVYGGNGVLGYSNQFLLREVTLILGRVGEYCGCAHLTEPINWISDNALYAKKQLLNVDLVFMKNCFEWMNLNQYSNKMGQPLITQGIINEIKFGLPTIREQKEISNLLKTFDSKLLSLQKKKQTLSDLFKTLLHELMTGQRRVHEIEFSGAEALEVPEKMYKIEEQSLTLAAEK